MTRLTRREFFVLAGTTYAAADSRTQAFSEETPMQPDMGTVLQKSTIWCTENDQRPGQFVGFRKAFALDAVPREATMHLFADARYMLWVNGKYVVRGPARFNPKGPEYDTINLHPYLVPGNNLIAVAVMGNASNGKMMKHVPCLTVATDLGKPARQSSQITTDTSWTCNDRTRYLPPRIEWGNVHDRIDTRAEDGDWTLPNYDDTKWKKAVLVDGSQWGALSQRRIPLLRETVVDAKFRDNQSLPITLNAGQNITLDAGRLALAYVSLDIDASDGSSLTIHGPDIDYIARAGRQTYLSSDTSDVSSVTLAVNAGTVTVHAFDLIERLYPFECLGSFNSNDELLNDIWAMSSRSVQLLSEDSYVDCADRERVEWMDDDPPGFDVTRTALCGRSDDGSIRYADPRLFGELLRRTALTQQPDGWVKAHTCSDRFDIHAYMEDRSCDWVEGARKYYESTGNISLIREIWPVVVSQLQWFLNRRTHRGLVRAREWVVWGNPMSYQTCEGTGLNCFIYKALADAAYLGKVLGAKEAAQFESASSSLYDAINTVLWNEAEGTYYSGFFADGDSPTNNQFVKFALTISSGLADPTMFPAMFALDQGVVPDTRRERVVSYLMANRAQAVRMMTCFYLFKQMLEQPDESLHQEVLDTMRTKFQAMAQTGWKTSWEDFVGGSKAHIYGAFPGYLLSAYVLGVRRIEPAWSKRILICPHLGDLTAVQGTVVTEFGPVPVSWIASASRLDFELTVPIGIGATVNLPRFGTPKSLVLNGKQQKIKEGNGYVTFALAAGRFAGTLEFIPSDKTIVRTDSTQRIL